MEHHWYIVSLPTISCRSVAKTKGYHEQKQKADINRVDSRGIAWQGRMMVYTSDLLTNTLAK